MWVRERPSNPKIEVTREGGGSMKRRGRGLAYILLLSILRAPPL
jgi:hypothetical protein